MTSTCWLNGSFVAESEARVSAFDRGFLFGDGVYEVTSMLEGSFIDADRHLARLERSLHEIGLASPRSADAWLDIMTETASRSGVRDGFVYMQVTRGPAERDFPFPPVVTPTALVYARAKDFRGDPLARTGAAVLSVPDLRWARRDIKSTSLLAQVLAKQQARASGAHEALMHHDGEITEGGASTVWLVRNGTLFTRPLSTVVLAGVTRAAVVDLAAAAGIPVVEQVFTVDEAVGADEVMITSATGFVIPVTTIDGRIVGDGAPGPITKLMRSAYIERALAR
jgi:D-alanine transaminase